MRLNWSIVGMILCLLLVLFLGIFNYHFQQKWQHQEDKDRTACEARGYSWYEHACVEFK